MRACVLHGTRDLRLEERPPAALAPGQVRPRFGAGGICGSDLHYYYGGRVGDFALREPLILGHEIAAHRGGRCAAAEVGGCAAVTTERTREGPAVPT